MSESMTLMAMAGSSLAGLSIAALATLKGWQGWLELKRLEIAGTRHSTHANPVTERIEMADLKERIRKLEAIAAGVDL